MALQFWLNKPATAESTVNRSAPTRLQAAITRLAPQVASAYVVGSDAESDALLCRSLDPSAQVMLFEQDFTSLGAISGVLCEHRNVVLWLRHIDDGVQQPECANLGLKVSVNGTSAGSLDQFWCGTGLPPELVKINTGHNLLNLLHGSTEILRLCKPLVLFRAPHSRDNPEGDAVELLQSIGYRIWDIEAEGLTESSPASSDASYLLAINEQSAGAVIVCRPR